MPVLLVKAIPWVATGFIAYFGSKITDDTKKVMMYGVAGLIFYKVVK